MSRVTPFRLPAALARRRACLALGGLLACAALPAYADAVDSLREFVRSVPSAKAEFTQTVVSPDGAKRRTSSGQFAFARPGRFRFAYDKPYEQLIVGDGQKVWIYDADLNQVQVRPMAQALGATPAALLAGGQLERDFALQAQPSADGLDWVLATPREADATVRQVRVGFRGKALAALELVDAFGQRSLLSFTGLVQGGPLPADTFRFTPPKGAEVLTSP